MTLEYLNENVKVCEVIEKQKKKYLHFLLIGLIYCLIMLLSNHYIDMIKSEPVNITYDESGDLSYETKMALSEWHAHSLDKALISIVMILSFLAVVYMGKDFYLYVFAFHKQRMSFRRVPRGEHEASLEWNETTFFKKRLSFAISVDENWVSADARPGMILTGLNPKSLVRLFAIDEKHHIYYIVTC